MNFFKCNFCLLFKLAAAIGSLNTSKPQQDLENNLEMISKDSTPFYIPMETKYLEFFKNKFHTNENKKILLFDMDLTLYKATPDFIEAEKKAHRRVFDTFKQKAKCQEQLKFNEDAIVLQTLYDEFDITPIEYEEAKALQYDTYIERDESLIKFLSNCDCRLWCFTNALKSRAETILRKLGIEKYFEGIIITSDNARRPNKKPYKASYEFVEKLLGVNKENRKFIYFFDDLERNLKPAKELGWNTFEVLSNVNVVDILKKDIKED